MRIPESLKIQCAEMANKSVAYREIYETVFLPEHQGMSFETFGRKLRGWRKRWGRVENIASAENFEEPETPCKHGRVITDEEIAEAIRRVQSFTYRSKPEVVGVFSDPHIPFDHPNYLQFCVDTFKSRGVEQIVCCGDLVDNHAISRHQTETCAKSPYDELDKTIARVAEYVNAFPMVKLCKGNHDDIPERQAATLGIGARYLKSFSELLNLPKTWEIADEFIINDVLYKHGINCMGKNGALNSALQDRLSTVIGHAHAFGGVNYSANPRDIIFGMNVGCGISISEYAFAYGKHDKNRPILGCGIVYNSGHAEFIPMPSSYFRN